MNLHIVTGGSRGLGQALIRFLAERGDDVAEISRSGTFSHPKIRSFNCDLANTESKEQVIRNIFDVFPIRKYQRLTLINNAGMVDPIMHVADLDEALLVKNINVNLASPVALTVAFLKHSSNFDGVRVIANVSTGVAKKPKGSWATYSSAKAGLECFSEALAKDFASDARVKTIVFEPGIIDTEMQALIRKTKPSDFDEVERFLNFKKDGQLLSAETVGSAFGNLVLKENLDPLTHISIYDLIS